MQNNPKTTPDATAPTAHPRLAVCSWSLQAQSPAELIDHLRATGLSRTQLALMPLLDNAAWDGAAPLLAEAGVSIVSGMIGFAGEDYSTFDSIRRTGGVVPDGTWEANRRSTTRALDRAHELHMERVSFHAGFIPPDPSDPRHATLVERLQHLADLAAARGVDILLETGQESADTLDGFLKRVERENVGVNFDPANMILYGTGDPIAALRHLIGHVRQVHIKDATASPEPGRWGAEIVAGQGEVDWPRFIRTLDENGYRGDLVIEREAGESRIDDVRRAAELISGLLG